MKKIKRIALLVVAVLVLLVAASGVKTVLDMKNSADNEVQEEDSTRWAEPTSDPLNIEGIADASAKYASAAVNGSLNLVFNGIWSRQTDYFTVPGGSLTITGYGTAEGTQRYKVSVWQKVPAAHSTSTEAPIISRPMVRTTAASSPGWTRRPATA